MSKPLFFQRSLLPHKAVIVHCCDSEGNPLENVYASGFLVRESGALYLYTCWHVVTGIDLHSVGNAVYPFDRFSLRMYIQTATEQPTGSKLRAFVLHGLTALDIPLFKITDDDENKFHPLWHQERYAKRLAYLESKRGEKLVLKVPDRIDAIRIQLPEDFATSDMHIIEEDELNRQLVFPGDRAYLVGYPYKFSATGDTQPNAVVLTRFIAGTSIAGRQFELLLDGPGARGMSGGPIFIERDDNIFLLGLYSGIVFTSDQNMKHEHVGSLGLCVDMASCWTHDIAELQPIECQ